MRLLFLLTLSSLSVLPWCAAMDLKRALANSRAAQQRTEFEIASSDPRAGNTKTDYVLHVDLTRRVVTEESALRKGEFKCKGRACQLDPNETPPMCGDSPCQHPVQLMGPPGHWTMV